MKEKDLQKQIRAYVQAKGGIVIKIYNGGMKFGDKFIPQNKNGVSDFLGVYKGKALAIETKIPGNKPTLLQRSFLDNWKDAGGCGVIAYNLEIVMAQLKEIDNETGG